MHTNLKKVIASLVLTSYSGNFYAAERTEAGELLAAETRGYVETQDRPVRINLSMQRSSENPAMFEAQLFATTSTILRGQQGSQVAIKLICDMLGFLPQGRLKSLVQNLHGVVRSFGCHIEGIDLCDNHIRVLEPGTFAGLTELRFLRLSSNCLQTLTPDILAGLPNLEILDIGENHAELTLSPAVFDTLQNLRILNLNCSHIAGGLPMGLCSGLHKLKGLGLPYNVPPSTAALKALKEQLPGLYIHLC